MSHIIVRVPGTLHFFGVHQVSTTSRSLHHHGGFYGLLLKRAHLLERECRYDFV